MPPPSRVAEHLGAGRATRTGSPVCSSADLICAHRPGRVALLEQRRGAGDVRRRHARAARAARTCPARRQRREDRRRPAPLTSGFIRSETGVGPAEEKSAIVVVRGDRGDGDRVGRAARRRDRAVAEVAEVVAGRDHRHDARRGGRVDRLHDEVARRLDLGLAEREVDHVHAVGDRRLDRRGDLGAVSVEPEVRASGSSAPCSCRGRRSARRPRSACRRRSCRGRRRRCLRRASRGTIAVGSNGVFAYFQVGDGGRERALHDHLRRRVLRLALREARRDTGSRSG